MQAFNTVAFIGFGHMATAISTSLLGSNYHPEHICAYGGQQQTRERTLKMGIAHKPISDITEDVLILAVKPQMYKDALAPYIGRLSPHTVVVSIMAGVSINQLKEYFPKNPVVRAMPNLAATFAKSVTALYTSEAEYLQPVKKLTDSFGQSFVLDDEAQINAFTAVAGSGPAHFLYMMNQMQKFLQRHHFSEDKARCIVDQVVDSTAVLSQQGQENFSETIERITSKGGTTEVALSYYKEIGFSYFIDESLKRSTQKSIELER